ncbi:hypothetical protein ACHAXR_013157 [Thalassiosira sp. AJA248-18]
MANNPHVDPGAADDRRSKYVAGTHFNELNRYLMLWNVAHLWKRGSRFTFNRYRHWGICIVRDRPGSPAIVIHSKEGVTQGDCRAMSIYGVGLMPLAASMRETIPEALQPWFADDAAGAGKAVHNAQCLAFLMEHGPKYGYFPEPDKCYYICKAEDEPVAKAAFEQHGLTINYTRGRRYLGGFIGSEATKALWLNEMVEKWVTAVQTLAQIARRFPQTVYCGFTFCLQNEWQYVQRVVADTAPFFAPLERAIRNDFIPALLDIPRCGVTAEFRALLTHGVKKGGLALRNPVDTASYVHEASKSATSHLTDSLIPRCGVTAEFRTLLTHSVKKGGLALRNPVDTASYVHEASKSATSHLTDSLVDATIAFDFRTHRERAEYFLQQARKQRLEREQDFLDARAEGAPAQLPATAERGDASCYGFWKRGRTCIFDVRITDTDVRSQRNKDVSKILAKHEKEKKDKYLRASPTLLRPQ